MKRTSVLTILITSAMMFATGCAGARGGADDGDADDGGSTRSGPALTGTRWVLLDIAGTAAEVAETTGDMPYLMLDDEGGVSGFTGVNFLSGTYERDGDELKFGRLITTRRAGPPPLMQQEVSFTRALDQTAGWRIREGSLELLDADGNPLTRFRASALETP
jgi:heat shock protein HslJ